MQLTFNLHVYWRDNSIFIEGVNKYESQNRVVFLGFESLATLGVPCASLLPVSHLGGVGVGRHEWDNGSQHLHGSSHTEADAGDTCVKKIVNVYLL